MSDDNDLIRRGDAIQQATRWLRGMIEADTIGGALKAIPAVQITVKPLEWQSTVDGAGHDHGVTLADCPVFEKRFWAERPDKQAKIDAKRAARILAALESAPHVNETPQSEHDRVDVLTAMPAPVTLAEALQVPEVRALIRAAKRVAFNNHHGNGLEALWAGFDALDATLRAIGEGEA